MNPLTWLSRSPAREPQTDPDASPGSEVYYECRQCGTAVDAETDPCPECGGAIATYRW